MSKPNNDGKHSSKKVKSTVKIRNSKTEEEADAMYRRAFYIGKFLMLNVPDRYEKFVSWIKKCKENKCPIRFVYNDTLYDFEIQDKNTGKWFRVGQTTSSVLSSQSVN